MIAGHTITRLLLGVAGLFCFLSAAGGELRIRCTTDLHGALSKMSELAPLLLPDDPSVLRIDAGDTIQGSFASQHDGGAMMIQLLNALHYDIWVPGNHDFEFGLENLQKRIGEFRGTTLGADWRPGWALIERGGLRCAVIGLGDPKMPLRRLPGEAPAFQEPAAALAALLPSLRAADPDLVILVWHNGLYSRLGTTAAFLTRFPEIDLVIGGHSHEEQPGKRIGRPYYVQAGSHGSAVGAIRVEFDDATGRILRISSQLLHPLPEAHEPAIAALAAPFLARTELIKVRPLPAFPNPIRRPGKNEFDAPFGRFAAAALLTATPEADAAVLTLRTGGGNLPPTEDALFSLFPYDNRVCVVTVERAEFETFVKAQLANAKKYETLPFFAGVTIEVDRRGRLRKLDCPERFRLAIADYLLLTHEAWKRRYRLPRADQLPLERDAIRRGARQL